MIDLYKIATYAKMLDFLMHLRRKSLDSSKGF